MLSLLLISQCLKIDSTFNVGYIPTCVTGCNLCGGALPFYANFKASYFKNVWRIKEGSKVDTRCGNGHTGSFAVLAGIWKKVYFDNNKDTIYLNINFRSNSLMDEYMSGVNILIVPLKVINQDSVLPSNGIFLGWSYRGKGIRSNANLNLNGFIAVKDSAFSFNIFPTSYNLKNVSTLLNDTVALFIGYSDAWFENFQITLETSGCYDIR
jgi:hypothetical protein